MPDSVKVFEPTLLKPKPPPIALPKVMPPLEPPTEASEPSVIAPE